MIAVCVTFTLDPAQVDAFLPLMRAQAQNTVQLEAGCHRFDICQDAEGSKVFLYELYTSRDAFQAHLDSAHFKSFDTAVAPMVRGKVAEIFDHVEPAGAG